MMEHLLLLLYRQVLLPVVYRMLTQNCYNMYFIECPPASFVCGSRITEKGLTSQIGGQPYYYKHLKFTDSI